MSDENNACKCPICNQSFTPADGMSAEEHLANRAIEVYAQMQNNATDKDWASNLPCPRCGLQNMNARATQNALSRAAKVYVCDACGNDEAMQASSGELRPLTSWWVAREIMGK